MRSARDETFAAPQPRRHERDGHAHNQIGSLGRRAMVASCPWKKSTLHLWIEGSSIGRPIERPRFSTVDGHRIQRCCTLYHSLLKNDEPCGPPAGQIDAVMAPSHRETTDKPSTGAYGSDTAPRPPLPHHARRCPAPFEEPSRSPPRTGPRQTETATQSRAGSDSEHTGDDTICHRANSGRNTEPNGWPRHDGVRGSRSRL